MATSQNGYSANDRSVIKTYNIEGELVPLRDDDCGFLLVDLAKWIHANVESISAGHQADDWGYAERTIRGDSTTLSNHASGTALDFNATQHPLGVEGTWSPQQKRRINRRLRNRYENVIRWGENYSGRVDGMHFEIDAGYDQVQRVARKIRRGGRRQVTVNLANVQEQFRAGGTRSIHGVRIIQRVLNKLRGEELLVDGWAGRETRRAYRRFERSIGAPKPDGIPGRYSLRVLGGSLPLPQRLRFRVKR